MKIEILGTGCPKCQLLTTRIEAVTKKLGVKHELCKVTSLGEIMKRGVMFTPALVLNGEVMVAGKVPSESDLTAMLKNALEEAT